MPSFIYETADVICTRYISCWFERFERS